MQDGGASGKTSLMTKPHWRLTSILKTEMGASTVEYGLVLCGVFLLAVASVGLFGTSVMAMFDSFVALLN